MREGIRRPRGLRPLSVVSGEREGRNGRVTVYSEETEDYYNGKNIKVVEVTGEKTNSHAMVKQKKGSSKSSEKLDLNIACLNLGKSDHEGWLSKKVGGHGIVRWKRKWCVLKDCKLYLYETSFDKSADHIYNVKEYTVVDVEEKKKCAFGLKPSSQDLKTTVFCGEQEDVDTVPDYEERKRVFSSTDAPKISKQPSKRHSAFQKETETTGMPATFANRTQSTSGAQRSRSISGKNDTSILGVGSMFKPLEEDEDSPTTTTTTTTKQNGSAVNVSYKELENEVNTSAVAVEKEKVDGRKPSNELETLIKEVEQLKTGTYKREQPQEKSEHKIDGVEPKEPIETNGTVAYPVVESTETIDATPSVPDSLKTVEKDWEQAVSTVTPTATTEESKEVTLESECQNGDASKGVTLSSELFYTGEK